MPKSWPEINNAEQENRHELILSGQSVSQRIQDDGIDKNLFQLTGLNFLNISDTCLSTLPDDVSKLVNLQSLMLHSNKLAKLPACLGKLTKLKLLDVSRNELTEVAVDFNEMGALSTLNLSMNKLEAFPGLTDRSRVSVLDVSHNGLTAFPDLWQAAHLSELKFNANRIEEIPHEIGQVASLKTVDFSDNAIKAIPAELSDLKLKEVNLKGNPVADRRLLKLIEQCRPKQVLDYVRQHGVRRGGDGAEKAKKTAGKKKGRKDSQGDEPVNGGDESYRYKIVISKDEPTNVPVVKTTENVKSVRAHILCCVVTGLRFDLDTFRKFIQMQTRLHDTVCDKRTASTLATHDLKKLSEPELTYDARPPERLHLNPLGSSTSYTAAQLYAKLRAEAEQLRKEKKRNVYSGIHRYLYLLEGKPLYPCILNAATVISFPPITNSDVTKMSTESTEMLVEATSSTSQDACRRAIEQLLVEVLSLGLTDTPNTLTVHRVRITDQQGNLRAVFPSRTDLKYEQGQGIKVIRE